MSVLFASTQSFWGTDYSVSSVRPSRSYAAVSVLVIAIAGLQAGACDVPFEPPAVQRQAPSPCQDVSWWR